MIVTGYSPMKVGNPYSWIVKEILKEAGYTSVSIKSILTKPKFFLECKVINLNWFENCTNFKTYYIKRIILEIIKKSHIKLVYTLHNKQPHDIRDSYYSKKLMYCLCEYADIIIGHCSETKDIVCAVTNCIGTQEKIRIIPLPNYINSYSNQYAEGIKHDKLTFLFFGTISQYKNVEIVIDIFNDYRKNDNIKLIIAGNVESGEYKDELIGLINGNHNIEAVFEYIPDEEVSEYYQMSDIVILPYNKESALNSSAAILCFTMRKTIICPDIGTVKDIPNKEFLYMYEYENNDEHKNALKIQIDKVIKEYSIDSNVLIKKGNAAYNYVKDFHARERVYEMYKTIYDDLCTYPKRTMRENK